MGLRPEPSPRESGLRKRRAQPAAFAEADLKVAAAAPGISKGERRPLAVDVMKDAMGPMAHFVRLETRMLAQKVTADGPALRVVAEDARGGPLEGRLGSCADD